MQVTGLIGTAAHVNVVNVADVAAVANGCDCFGNYAALTPVR